MVGPSNSPAETLASVHAKVPPDPLQRKRELIAHYDRHGYPERARYLERAHLGPELAESTSAGDPSAIARLLEWWAGKPSADLFAKLARVDELEKALPRAAGSRDRVEAQLQSARGLLLGCIDGTLASGLLARVTTRLEPLGPRLPTADSIAYRFLLRARELAGGQPPARLRVELSPPHHDGITSAYVIVCERCSHVGTSTRPNVNCGFCAKRHPRPEGGLALSLCGLDELPLLITGDSTVYVRSCVVCGEVFVAARADAQTCPDKSGCRVKKHRARRLSD
jgi:hypothetical protein